MNKPNWKYKKLSQFQIESFKGPNIKEKGNIGSYFIIPSGANFPDGIKLNKCKKSESLEGHENKLLKENDLLFNTGGVGTLGRVGIYKGYSIHAVADGFILIIRNRDELLDTNFLFYFFQSFEAKDLIRKYTRGTTGITSIKPSDIFSFEIPLPPLPTQLLIVSEIEKQFSRLDDGLSSLLRIRQNLKSYRASILKSAVEGRLTEEWRKEQKDIEPASILLTRILEERKRKFLSENPGKKYKEPLKLEFIPNIELPKEWIWTNMDSIILNGPQNGLYKPASYYGKGISILRIDDYQYFWIKEKDDLRKITLTDPEMKTYGLNENDLVINRVNSMTHIGKCILIDSNHIPCVFESNMMRIEMTHNVLPKYVQLYLSSANGIHETRKNAKQAVNQASINQQDIKSIPVPLPPLAEQQKIVEEVEYRLSIVDELEQTIEAGIKKAENLKQAILKKAFGGELVKEEEKQA